MLTTNLPAPATSFIGREQTLSKVVESVRDGARLVTLVGAPGTGKSRLAVEVGRAGLVASTECRVWVCDLTETSDVEEIRRAVARVLGVVLPADPQSLHAAMCNQGPMLLILDNAEHIVADVADLVGHWLEATPEMQLLVTSRQRLGLKAEQCFDVGPLGKDEAIALFEDRARQVRRDFVLTEDMHEAVTELVAHLDGIPLAVELAAARVNALPPVEMLRRISSRFRLLRDRSAHGERGATLEAAIEWSWNLLDDHERQALIQCAVFRGGFSLEAAEEVVAFAKESDPWVVDVIEALNEKSLLRREEPAGFAGEVRFGIFESIREFALKQDDPLDLRARAEERHGTYYLGHGRGLAESVQGSEGARWLERLELEQANLSAVVERFVDDDPPVAIEAILILDGLMRYIGPLGTHIALLERAVQLARASPAHLLRLYVARGKLAMLRGEIDEGLEDFERARAIATDLEEAELGGWAIFHCAEAHRQKGRTRRAIELHEEALAHARSHSLLGLERMVLAHLASCHVDLEEHDEARDLLERLQVTRPQANLYDECQINKRIAYVQYYLGAYEEQSRYNERALELARQIGDQRQVGLCLQGLGDCAFVKGDFKGARESYEAALTIHCRLGNRHYEGILRGNLGGAHHRDGSLDAARRNYVESLEIHRQTGARPYEAVVLFALGALEFEQGHRDRARHYFERSLDQHVELGQSSDEGALELSLGLLAIESEDFISARTHLDRARECLSDEESPGWELIASIATAALDAREGHHQRACTSLEALNRSSPGELEAGILRLLENYCALAMGTPDALKVVAATLKWARRAGEEWQAPLVKRSLHARLIAVWLERFLQRSQAPTEGLSSLTQPSTADEECLVVGPEGRWFEWADGERVDLRRRRSIRLILDWLTDQRQESTGVGTDVYSLFDIGWPGEIVEPETAGERVYWAVRTLRKLGLE
ncbi:MAG: ATP-binding protein, partial [Bradymonadaceae bacterium]